MTEKGSQMSEQLFTLNEVSKIYGDVEATQVRAVDRVSLTVKRGEFSALVGPSGSGKTTLLNLMSGLDKVSSGEVNLGGKNIAELNGNDLSDYRRDHIGFIFQAYNLIPVLSARENIEYVMMLQGVAQRDRHARVDEILKDVGLDGMAERRTTQLSGGQQQRVAVARAMASNPDLILADEPTANLDSTTGAALLDMMRDLNQTRGMTFVFSTHDSMIMDRARRLVTLKDGQVDSDDVR